MKAYSIAVMAIVIGFMSTPIQADTSLSLSEAIALALEQNHDIRMALNNEKIARNNVNIGNAGLLPTIDLVSTSNYVDQDPAFGDDFSSTQNNAKIQASLMLFNGLGNIYSFQKLKKSGRVEELATRVTIEATVLSVSQAYYDLANAQERLRVTEEAILISNDRYLRAERQAEYGQANAVDVLSAQVDLNADSTTYFTASLAVEQAHRKLGVLLNADLENRYEVETDVEYVAPPDLEAMQQGALNANASFLMSLTAMEQADLDLKLARSNYWPQLTLQTSYGYNQTAPGYSIDYGDPDRQTTVGLSLSFNLFNGFQDKVRTSNAKIAKNSRLLNYNRAKLDLKREVANAFDAYENSRTILALQQRNLKSAELNFQRTEQLYELGQATTTTFREAQLNMIQSRNNISSAKYDAKLAEMKLLQLAGKLLE